MSFSKTVEVPAWVDNNINKLIQLASSDKPKDRRRARRIEESIPPEFKFRAVYALMTAVADPLLKDRLATSLHVDVEGGMLTVVRRTRPVRK